MANIEKPKPLPRNLASTDSKPIPLTKLGLKIIDKDMKPPKNIKKIAIGVLTADCAPILIYDQKLKIISVIHAGWKSTYKDIIKNLKYLNWPNDPKTIITSYDHAFNDPFKIYAANKIMNGSKLFILQHGSAGLHDYCNSYYEKNICDKYLSWGNKSKDKITYPMFVSTTVGKKIKKGTILI